MKVVGDENSINIYIIGRNKFFYKFLSLIRYIYECSVNIEKIA